MKKFKFDEFKIEIVEPTITINPIIRELDPNKMTIQVDVILEDSSGSKFGVTLENVAILNLTYTAESLQQRVLEHLENFKI